MSRILEIDKERALAERATQTIFHHILRDYIAEANRQEVMSNLYNFFKDGDIALISKQELRVYQELEKLSINAGFLKPNGVIPNKE